MKAIRVSDETYKCLVNYKKKIEMVKEKEITWDYFLIKLLKR